MPHRLRHRSRERKSSITHSVFTDAASQSESYPGNQLYDALGLHLVYDNSDPIGDIIFVHGLGGTARKTWCWNGDVECFWPMWLADEEALSSYRIFTFGYNSNFKSSGNNLNITDFAKDLLFQMLTFSGGLSGNCVPIGHRAVIFVAHSMGGLVVKKACILGKHDREFAGIISQVYGIVFLGTPHRGAQYAKTLNNILSITPVGGPPKAYVADLDTLSGTLQDINEQFRIICEGFALVSFFETLKTSFGVTKIHVRQQTAH
jgi:pimeloyl-ACP methyl ester carboxylesterase